MENKITVTGTGPYMVTGTMTLTDANGNRIEKKETFALCRCGHSWNKPFCDGQHRTNTDWLNQK